MRILLEKPQTAYYVQHVDCIIPLTVAHRFTEQDWDCFAARQAVWVSDRYQRLQKKQSPRMSLTLDPSARGNPFEHPHVGWTLEEAVAILRDASRKQAAYCHEEAAEQLARARLLETFDYHKVILGDSADDKYVSPFTGKER